MRCSPGGARYVCHLLPGWPGGRGLGKICNANGKQQPGLLVAGDAGDLKRSLYRCDADPERDTLGLLGKFVSPTVAAGRVWVALPSKAAASCEMMP